MKCVLVSDFDNTLYVQDENVFSRNLEALKKFTDAGNIFIIATGRNKKNISELIHDFSISCDYLICHNGAEIYDKDLNLIHRSAMDPEMVEQIKKIASENNNEYIESKSDDGKYTIGVFVKKDGDLDAILDYIKDKTYNYFSFKWLNIVKDGVNKGEAVKILENKFLNDCKIFTIGDAINDIDMIKLYNGARIKDHEEVLNNIDCKEYACFYEYVERIMKDNN